MRRNRRHQTKMENPNDEPVLLVPPKLTKSAYAILLDHNLVPRKWHPEGRYGSRTHKFKDKIGLPLLLSCQVQIQAIQAMLDPNHHHHHHRPNDSIGIHASISLCKLLKEPGVELVFKPAVVSNRIPRDEPFDASIHPHLMPAQFSTKLKKMIQNMQEYSNPSSSSSPLSSPSPWKKQRNAPLFTFCELFAGIGGFGVALEALGGKCVFASEIYAPSKSVYENNADTSMLPLPHHRVSGDIWDISSANIPRHDLLVAGFPCQPFSSLGDQPGLNDGKHISGRNHKCLESESNVEQVVNSGGGRGQLFTQIVRILKDVQPHAFLLENVPGLVTTDGGDALRTIVEALEGVGYRVKYEICSARGMTVQSRKRLYIVGILELNEKVDVNDDGSGGSREFQFPFMPDLQLRAKHILHSERELDESFTATGIPEELMEDCDFGDDVPTPAQLYRLTDAQMDQLRNRSKVWRPAKLAWGNTSCDTIDSHYGITIGKVSARVHTNQSSILIATHVAFLIIPNFLILTLRYLMHSNLGQFTISPVLCSFSSSTLYSSRMRAYNGI